MKRKGILTFYFLKNKKGGILFPVLAILMMFTCLLLFVTQDYFSRRELLVNTRDYYLAKTMEEMSSKNISFEEFENQRVFFNIGTSSWSKTETPNEFLVESSLSNQYKRTSYKYISNKR